MVLWVKGGCGGGGGEGDDDFYKKIIIVSYQIGYISIQLYDCISKAHYQVSPPMENITNT